MRKRKIIKEQIVNPDQVREDVLNYLYKRYKKSRSVSKQAATISEIKKSLKAKGYKEQEIVGAISFLIDRGWIKIERKKVKFFIKNRLTESEKVKYRISDVGITHFEGPSKFYSSNKFSGINITNIQGVTVVGNNNIVRNEYLNLFNALEELGELVRSSNILSDTDKVDVQNDLETIKNQIGKTTPNKNIIRIAWESIKSRLENIAEFADLVMKIASLIKIFM